MTKELTKYELELQELWNVGGLSMQEIAEKIGTSRNTVAGALSRIRAKGPGLLKSRQMQRKSPALPFSERAKKPREAKPKPAPRLKAEAALFSAAAAPEPMAAPGETKAFDIRQASIRAPDQLDVHYGRLRSNQCQWPGWSGQDKIGTCCGLPVLEGKKWCQHHYNAAVQPAQVTRRENRKLRLIGGRHG